MQYSIELQNKCIADLEVLHSQLIDRLNDVDEDWNPDLAHYLKDEARFVKAWLDLRNAELEVRFAQSRLRDIEHSRSGAYQEFANRIERQNVTG